MIKNINNIRRKMVTDNAWYEGSWYGNGISRVFGRRFISLGRHEFYISFAKRISKSLGATSYLLDFMTWIDPGDPYKSLLYYIKSAERIDINLQGISVEFLKKSTTGIGHLVSNRGELKILYMTCWEINQIFYNIFRKKAYFHTGGVMSQVEAYKAMGEEVKLDHIFESPEEKNISIFPKSFKCPECDKKLSTSKSGKFKCPFCKEIVIIDSVGTPYLSYY